MKLIALTKGQFAMVDDADYELVNSYKWCAHKHGNSFRAMRNNRWTRHGEDWATKNTTMHRFLMKAANGTSIDHIDRNPLNNQRANLRFCTHSQNIMNATKIMGCISRFKGVTKRSNCRSWIARIFLNGKNKNIGRFSTEIEAALAYNFMAAHHFGEFALLNEVHL